MDMGGGQRSKPTLTPTETILLDIVRLAVAGHGDRIPARLRRLLSGASARRTDAVSPACRDALLDLLKTPPSDPPRRTAGLRVHESARVPQQPPGRTEAPVFAPRVADTLERIVRERREGERLQQLGLEPTRTILLSGPPGVGKTMTAEYLATQLDLPLLRAEPSTVITSLLGESARRLAETFAEASAHPCVLLLDEFDAFAKRRDDAHELGELKRFVTTLLVEIERFPASSLLVAATNHPQLLDPAIDRRFDVVVDLPLPGEAERTRIVSDQLRATGLDATSRAVGVLVAGSVGMSGSAIARAVKTAARRHVLDDEPLELALLRATVGSDPGGLDDATRAAIAEIATDVGRLSTRAIGDLLGCSHSSVRRLRTRNAKAAA